MSREQCPLCGSLVRHHRQPIICQTPMGSIVAPCNADWHRQQTSTLTLVVSEGSEPVLTIHPSGTVTFDADKFYRAITDMQRVAWAEGRGSRWRYGEFLTSDDIQAEAARLYPYPATT